MPSSLEVVLTYFRNRMGEKGVNPECIPEFADLFHGFPRTSDLRHSSDVLFAFHEWALGEENHQFVVDYHPDGDVLTVEELREAYISLAENHLFEPGVDWVQIYLWISITVDMVFEDVDLGNNVKARHLLIWCAEILDKHVVQAYITANGGWGQAPNPLGIPRNRFDTESVALGTNLIIGLSMLAAMTVHAINYFNS